MEYNLLCCQRNNFVVCILKINFGLSLSSSSFVIRVNLFHSLPSLFLYGLLLYLSCCSILINHYVKVSSNLKVILYMTKSSKCCTWALVTRILRGTLIPRFCMNDLTLCFYCVSSFFLLSVLFLLQRSLFYCFHSCVQDHLDKCLVKLASETMLRERNCFERYCTLLGC